MVVQVGPVERVPQYHFTLPLKVPPYKATLGPRRFGGNWLPLHAANPKAPSAAPAARGRIEGRKTGLVFVSQHAPCPPFRDA